MNFWIGWDLIDIMFLLYYVFMSNDVEFLVEEDEVNIDGPKRFVGPPVEETASWSVKFILKTGIVKSKAVATGITVGSSIFFISLAIVISTNIFLSPTSSYMKNRFPVTLPSEQPIQNESL